MQSKRGWCGIMRAEDDTLQVATALTKHAGCAQLTDTSLHAEAPACQCTAFSGQNDVQTLNTLAARRFQPKNEVISAEVLGCLAGLQARAYGSLFKFMN
jgi:hypothetical protein